MQDVGQRIILPVLQELARHNSPFSGLLYPGLMMTSDGPKVLEFNTRFGDPEVQVYMRLMESDLLPALESCIDGQLAHTAIKWRSGFAVCVVLCSGGYPGEYKIGLPITGIQEAEKIPGVVVFHAGTILDNGQVKTAGGRVLSVTAIGASLTEALNCVYRAVSCIHFDEMHYRKDIGQQALSKTI